MINSEPLEESPQLSVDVLLASLDQVTDAESSFHIYQAQAHMSARGGHSVSSEQPLWNIRNCSWSVGWTSCPLSYIRVTIFHDSTWNHVGCTLWLTVPRSGRALARTQINATLKKKKKDGFQKTILYFLKFQGEKLKREVGTQRCLWGVWNPFGDKRFFVEIKDKSIFCP